MRAEAQAVVLFTVQNVAARFLKSLRRAGYARPVFAISVINADTLAAQVGVEDARGVGVVQVVPAPNNPRFEVAREFQAMVARTGRGTLVASQSALEGFIVGKLIAVGMKKARAPLTRVGFGEAMRDLGVVDLGGLRAALLPAGAQGPHYMDLGVIDATGRLRN